MHHPFSRSLALAVLAAPACFAAPANFTSASCPVALTATQRGAGQLLALETATAPTGSPQQAIDLSLTNAQKRRIVSIDLEVHGTADKGRVLSTSSSVVRTGQPSTDAVRRVHLNSEVSANEERTSTVAVQGLTSVGWIAITALHYADGTTWTSDRRRSCAVRPSGLMLLAGK